jgi:hypothetical protein
MTMNHNRNKNNNNKKKKKKKKVADSITKEIDQITIIKIKNNELATSYQ